jgi:hypothetical protein
MTVARLKKRNVAARVWIPIVRPPEARSLPFVKVQVFTAALPCAPQLPDHANAITIMPRLGEGLALRSHRVASTRIHAGNKP